MIGVAFFGFVGFFANGPAYPHLGGDQALIKLSFSHAGQRIGDCRIRTDEELESLPENMRKRRDCPRERSPVEVLLRIDGEPVFHRTVAPSGLWGGGKASVYERFRIPAGAHRIEARLRDDVDLEAFNHTGQRELRIAPGQVLVIDFSAAQGGFLFDRATTRDPGKGDP